MIAVPNLDIVDFGCFVRGTLIETASGPQVVEHLVAGSRVVTRDNGYKPIRKVISTRPYARGRFTPIFFSKGTVGNHANLMVSPEQRILITGQHVTDLTSHHDVLAAAKLLTNNTSIIRLAGGWADYFHIQLDQSEVVLANGCWSECSDSRNAENDGVNTDASSETPEATRRCVQEKYYEVRDQQLASAIFGAAFSYDGWTAC